MDSALATKHRRLKEILRETGGAVLGFSGGVDSTLLLAAGVETLGERLLAVTARGPLIPARELSAAAAHAAALGARHRFVDLAPLDLPAVGANTKERCYRCKAAVFGRFAEIAREEGLPALLAGDNLDDLSVHRPGRRALEELGVRAPLVEAGFTKADVRALSRRLGLPTADAPTVSCLATRFPYDTPLTPEALARVDRLEEFLLGIAGEVTLRVRMHGDLARIEIDPASFPALLARREEIAARFRSEGVKHVALDLSGFRTGSMDE